ncbi:hypothetical protein [Blastococcus sp. SYSU D00813]
MTQESGAVGRGGSREPRRSSRADRLLGGAADPGTPRPRVERPEAPVAVRRAALVVALEAALLFGGALVLLYLTLTGDPESVKSAVGEVVYVSLFGAAMTAAAVGLWRASAWARGPVVTLQLILAAVGFYAAFHADRPEIGIPVLALVAVELYLLATPEARLAFFQRSGE